MYETPSPPHEPPAAATQEMLWRLAARLFHDHRLDAGACPSGPTERPQCAACHQPWPCSGRRMAELGLFAARG